MPLTHGLKIHCDINGHPFPELGDAKPDVVVRLRTHDAPALTPDASPDITAQQLTFVIADVGHFRITRGARVDVWPADGVAPRDVLAYVTGGCIGAALLQRGAHLFHASSVVIGGKAFLVCGRSGAGKSTTVAHLAARGAATIGDDISTLDWSRGGALPWVLSGLPTTRLAPSALAALGREEAEGTPCAQGKRWVKAGPAFVNGSFPLAGIIALSARNVDAVSARQMPWAEALKVLCAQMYRRRWLGDQGSRSMFERNTLLAHNLPVWRVVRPNGTQTMTETAALIERLAHGVANHDSPIATTTMTAQPQEAHP